VVEDGRVVGMLRHDRLLAILTRRGPMARVGDAMVTEFETARSDEPLVGAFERLVRSKGSSIPVVDEGMLVGLLTMESVNELMSIRAAMDAAQLRAHGDTAATAPWRPEGGRSAA
jgi:predicted transcriptional regulator